MLLIIITIALIIIILSAIGLHYLRRRHIIDQWREDDDELSPIITSKAISVVVICHNEGREMEQNIPLLFNQKGVDIEIIVVNAASTDTTFEALRRLTLQYPQLRQTYLPHNNVSINISESAHLLGARAARNEWVLYLSPTFVPPSDLWLLDLTRYAESSVKAVIDYDNGYSTERTESERRWKRRYKKMTRTVRKGRAIITAGGSLLIKRNWILSRADEEEQAECIYICRSYPPLKRFIARVQNRRPDFSVPL